MVNKECKLASASRSASELRAEDRTTSIYRPVLIETEEFAGFCLVRNLSPNGMMGRVYAKFAAGQPVTIQFHPDHVVSGMAVWSKEGQIGVRFNEEIDVMDMLQALGSKHIRGKINRAPRLQFQCNGELLIGDRTLPIKVQDISQRGLKAAASFVQAGDEVIVRLKDMDPRKAIVRWTEAGAAGLNFVRPLGFEELAEWVICEHSAPVEDVGRRQAPAGTGPMPDASFGEFAETRLR